MIANAVSFAIRPTTEGAIALAVAAVVALAAIRICFFKKRD